MIQLGARRVSRFEAAGKPFVYLVPSAAMFALDDAADAVLRRARRERPRTRDELVAELLGAARARRSRATRSPSCARVPRASASSCRAAATPPPKIFPLTPFPLTTMVLNVTNQCNLSCTYCYEYGEDKIVDTENGKKPKFMSEETARAERGVHAQGVGRQQGRAHDVLRRRDAAELPGAEDDDRLRAAARRRGRQGGRLQPHDQRARCCKPEIIEFLAENERRRHDLDRRPAARCRTSSASSTTARAATTSSRRRSRSC